MSNEQLTNKIDEVQTSVSETLKSLKKILQRTRDLNDLEQNLRKTNQIKVADDIAKIKEGLMDDIDVHIDSLSKLIREYQEFVSETI